MQTAVLRQASLPAQAAPLLVLIPGPHPSLPGCTHYTACCSLPSLLPLPACRPDGHCRRRRPAHVAAFSQQGEDPTARINSISFHRTEDFLVSASDDDTIRLYNTQTGVETK